VIRRPVGDAFIVVDLEYLAPPFRERVWLAGAAMATGPGLAQIHQFWADDTDADERKLLENLGRLLDAHPRLPVVTWSGCSADIPADAQGRREARSNGPTRRPRTLRSVRVGQAECPAARAQSRIETIGRLFRRPAQLRRRRWHASPDAVPPIDRRTWQAGPGHKAAAPELKPRRPGRHPGRNAGTESPGPRNGIAVTTSRPCLEPRAFRAGGSFVGGR
jgi:hypothetical protein